MCSHDGGQEASLGLVRLEVCRHDVGDDDFSTVDCVLG